MPNLSTLALFAGGVYVTLGITTALSGPGKSK